MGFYEFTGNSAFILTDKNYNIPGEKYLCNYGKFPSLIKNTYRRNDMFFETERAFYIFEKYHTTRKEREYRF